jgi:hypothetical protein
MSFTFYVAVPTAPSVEMIADLVDDPGWTCDNAGNGGPMADGFVCHAYRYGESARGVELAYENGALGARIMTCSTRADHELAIAIVRAVAELHDTEVRPEDGDAMSLDALAEAYGDPWIEHQLEWAPTTVIAMVDREGSTLTMSGVCRPFHLGPRFLGTLRERSGGTLGERLLDAFVALQNVDEEAYYVASTMTIKPKGDDDAEGHTLAVWAQDVSYLFARVDRLVILADAAPLEVPYARGPELAGAGWTWLDEEHALVEAVSELAWPDLVRRARAFVVH